MKVSVVIPVYNAERYIRSAVESALSQAQVAEVVLVEDKSPDNCLEICQALASSDSRVSLVRHPNGENRGAGASRNLGILSAKNDIVAFLDADDYFLPNRFAQTEKVFSENPKVDGVYEAAGAEFETEEAKSRYLATHAEEVATVVGQVSPQDLFSVLMAGGSGYIHLDGLAVKKEALIKVGMFPELRLHQDMVLTVKLAALCTLVAGSTQAPVSIRRLHMDNRITNPNTNFSVTRLAAAENLFRWAVDQQLDAGKVNVLRKAYYGYKFRQARIDKRFGAAVYYYVKRKVCG